MSARLYVYNRKGEYMHTISVANIKGGVGKSSVAATLAAGLARRGYRVLMVDSDPQTNLTMCFLPEQPDDAPSLYHVFCGEKGIEDTLVSVMDNLDLVIGDFSLCNADMQFVKAGRLKMLGRALGGIRDGYDFIIVDTPPNLGILSLNAFMASDYIIVPIAADTFSLKGVRMLKQALDDVREETEREILVAGLLLTRYNSKTNVSRLLEKSVHAAAGLLGTQVFRSRIRQAVVVQESQTAKEDLFSYAPKASVTLDYAGFVDEFLERVGD